MSMAVVDASPFSRLEGKVVLIRKQGTSETIMTQYERWLNVMTLDVTIMTVLTLGLKPNEVEHPKNGLVRDQFHRAFGLAEALLETVPCNKLIVESFAGVLTEFENHPNYAHSGIFLSALIQKTGPDHYRIPKVDDIKWLGYGLENVAISTAAVGNFSAPLQRNAIYAASMQEVPIESIARARKGVLFITQNTGNYAAWRTENVIVHNGTLGEYLGCGAERMTIHAPAKVGNHAGFGVTNLVWRYRGDDNG